MKLQNITLGAIANASTWLLALGASGAWFWYVAEQPLTSQQAPAVITGDNQGSGRRNFAIEVTLSQPQDLKVRQGDSVAAGEIIADRAVERARLEQQRKQLAINLKRLQSQETKPMRPLLPVPPIAPLPAPNFMDQQAAISAERVKVQQAEWAVDLQQRKLDLLRTMDGVPTAVLAHEDKKLQDVGRKLEQATAELAMAQAKLELAKAERLHQEYEHSLKITANAQATNQQELEINRQEQLRTQTENDRQFRITQVEAQIIAIDERLRSLAAVRSPYSGKVIKIKWEGQSDLSLKAIVTLSIDSSQLQPTSTIPTATPSPSATTGSGGKPGTTPGQSSDRAR
jgi:biotin carboxyl carrier protein